MSKSTGRPSFRAGYASFKSGVIDDTSVNALTFGRASGKSGAARSKAAGAKYAVTKPATKTAARTAASGVHRRRRVISTRRLDLLPDVEGLRRLSRSLALLDAVLCPEWEDRYYSFDSRWDPAAGEAMASMRNGQGDGYFVLFTPAGAIAQGFAHEAPMAPDTQEPPRVWPGVLDAVPAEFAHFLAEPAFSLADTTFCVWRRRGDPSWQRGEIVYPAGEDPDGSAALLGALDGVPETYRAWAEAYYELPVDGAAVSRIYAHEPLTQELVAALNPDRALDDLEEDLEEIGYPSASR